jgi:hypothetical protein
MAVVKSCSIKNDRGNSYLDRISTPGFYKRSAMKRGKRLKQKENLGKGFQENIEEY